LLIDTGMHAIEPDDLLDDPDAMEDMIDAPRVDEQDVEDDGNALSLLEIEREYEIDEADITEEIDLDRVAPADDGYDTEYV
jgi:hypothetical protein